MFDVGFSELVVIGIVALVVIGPERLPRVARTAGVLFGRLQRYVAQVKADIGREIEMSDLQKAKQEFESAARTFKAEVETKGADVEREIRDAQAQIERDLAVKTDGAPLVEPTANAPAAAALPETAPEPSPQLELGLNEPQDPQHKA
jgi:sec-independent protein translocase protein TatB